MSFGSARFRSAILAARRVGGASLLIAVAAIVLPLAPGASTALQFDRTLIIAGEWWRLVTCHLTHWSMDHLIWDVVVFAAAGVVLERSSLQRFAWTVFLSSVAISAAVWWLLPGMQTYRGLSGIDSALFAGLMMQMSLGENRLLRRGAVVLLLMFAAKILWEMSMGNAIFVDTSAGGFVPVPLAHLAGGLAGAAVAFAPRAVRFFQTHISFSFPHVQPSSPRLCCPLPTKERAACHVNDRMRNASRRRG